MPVSTLRTKVMPLGAAGALALVIAATAGFSADVVARPAPDKTAAAAKVALAKGQVDKAIQLAEAVVAANPRESSYRALLAQAYLKAGRFQSAATTFDDAMKLGDTSAKTALGLALSYAAEGRNRDAVSVLEDWRDAIPAADLGLAMALAGEPTRGSAILADALRNGENTPKLRQNLAYSYALDGRWREARLMMSQDVPADQIDARISEWAASARPEDYHVRIAGLLNAPRRTDPGQPARLALNAPQEAGQLAALTLPEPAPRQAPPVAREPSGELPPLAAPQPAAELAEYTPVNQSAVAPVEPAVVAPAPAPAAPVRASAARNFAEAFVAQGAAAAEAERGLPAGVTFVSRPVVQAIPLMPTRAPRGLALAAPRSAAQPAAGAIGPRSAAGGMHNVQLGSFLTEQGARRAWSIYAARNPELRNYRMTISQAQVRGKTYYRVAAAGINGSRGAWSLCGTVKARGMGCFAYSALNGVPGSNAFATAPKGLAAPALVRRR